MTLGVQQGEDRADRRDEERHRGGGQEYSAARYRDDQQAVLRCAPEQEDGGRQEEGGEREEHGERFERREAGLAAAVPSFPLGFAV